MAITIAPHRAIGITTITCGIAKIVLVICSSLHNREEFLLSNSSFV